MTDSRRDLWAVNGPFCWRFSASVLWIIFPWHWTLTKISSEEQRRVEFNETMPMMNLEKCRANKDMTHDEWLNLKLDILVTPAEPSFYDLMTTMNTHAVQCGVYRAGIEHNTTRQHWWKDLKAINGRQRLEEEYSRFLAMVLQQCTT